MKMHRILKITKIKVIDQSSLYSIFLKEIYFYFSKHLFTDKLHLIISSSVTGLITVINKIYLAEGSV